MYEFEELDNPEEQIPELLEEDVVELEETMGRSFDSLEDIVSAMESIVRLDGVNKDLAVSFERLLPENVPVNSFTKSPTKTNLKVLVASLEGFVGNVLVAIGAAIATFIVALFARFLRRKSGQTSADEAFTAYSKARDAVDIEEQEETPKFTTVTSKFNAKMDTIWTQLQQDIIDLQKPYLLDILAIDITTAKAILEEIKTETIPGIARGDYTGYIAVGGGLARLVAEFKHLNVKGVSDAKVLDYKTNLANIKLLSQQAKTEARFARDTKLTKGFKVDNVMAKFKPLPANSKDIAFIEEFKVLAEHFKNPKNFTIPEGIKPEEIEEAKYCMQYLSEAVTSLAYLLSARVIITEAHMSISEVLEAYYKAVKA